MASPPSDVSSSKNCCKIFHCLRTDRIDYSRESHLVAADLTILYTISSKSAANSLNKPQRFGDIEKYE